MRSFSSFFISLCSIASLLNACAPKDDKRTESLRPVKLYVELVEYDAKTGLALAEQALRVRATKAETKLYESINSKAGPRELLTIYGVRNNVLCVIDEKQAQSLDMSVAELEELLENSKVHIVECHTPQINEDTATAGRSALEQSRQKIGLEAISDPMVYSYAAKIVLK